MSKVMKIVLIVLLVIVLAVVGLGVYVLTSMRSDAVETVEKPVDLVMESTEAPEEIVVSDEATPTPTAMPIYEEQSKVASVVNILLIGTDSRTAAEVQDAEGRSDSMMLASINTEKGTITLVSFLRDARVHRVGKSGRFTFFNRLNGAYSGGYGGGGPGELINTLNENFKLDIQEYVSIGFDGFAALIDKIGGLDVDCDEAEINFINDRIKGNFVNEPDIVRKASTIKEDPGIIHLDGAQCLIYARNRHTGFTGGQGNDIDRVNRQQEIIELVFAKVTKEMNEQSVLALISFATGYVSTNMSIDTMSELAKILLTKGMTFTKTVFPTPGTYHNYVDEDGVETSLLEFDIDQAATELNKLLYGESFVPTPTPAN